MAVVRPALDDVRVTGSCRRRQATHTRLRRAPGAHPLRIHRFGVRRAFSDSVAAGGVGATLAVLMDVTRILFVVVCGVATLNSLFLAGYLWMQPKGVRLLNRLLALLLLTFSLRVSKAVAIVFATNVHPVFELAWIGILAVTGPVALLYLSLLDGGVPRARRLALRAGLAGVAIAVLLFLGLPLNRGWRLMAGALAIYGASVAGPLAAAFGPARDGQLSDGRRRWARAVASFLAIVWVLHVTLVAGPMFRGWEDGFFDAEALFFSIAVYALIFVELKFSVIGRVHQADAREQIPADDPMLKRLRQVMESERAYLDPGLSLGSLAKSINLSPQHVSRLINAGVGCSFTDYVNRLRVEEARRLLAEPGGASRKIGLLAFDCGFNSPSVFYAAFRKFSGKTPSEYVKSLTRT